MRADQGVVVYRMCPLQPSSPAMTCCLSHRHTFRHRAPSIPAVQRFRAMQHLLCRNVDCCYALHAPSLLPNHRPDAPALSELWSTERAAPCNAMHSAECYSRAHSLPLKRPWSAALSHRPDAPALSEL